MEDAGLQDVLGRAASQLYEALSLRLEGPEADVVRTPYLQMHLRVNVAPLKFAAILNCRFKLLPLQKVKRGYGVYAKHVFHIPSLPPCIAVFVLIIILQCSITTVVSIALPTQVCTESKSHIVSLSLSYH